MSEKERLIKTLFDEPSRAHVNVKFFRGTSEVISEEELCAEVNAALFQVQNHLIEPREDPEEELKQIEVRELSIPA